MTTLADQIRTAYAEDQRRRPMAVAATDIPISYDAITPEWLTAILFKGKSGARVVGYSLDKTDSGTSNRRRIFLEYNEAGRTAGGPNSVFCKATHDLPNRLILGHSGGVVCEVTFYTKARPLVDIEAPTPIHAAYDPVSFNSIIVLQDMGDRVEFATHRTPMNRARAESQMDLLSRLHGRFLQAPELDRELKDLVTWHQRFHNLARFKLEGCCENGFRAAEAVIPPRLFARASEIWPATLASAERHLSLPQTLTHGDVHLKNWYIVGGEKMGLSDWQVTNKGHWSRDLAYTISTALTTENRRAWERDLITRYIGGLAEQGAPPISLDAAFTLYRQQLFSALAFWTLTLTPAEDMPDMQPRDTTIEFIGRIAHAIDDVDALAAFG